MRVGVFRYLDLKFRASIHRRGTRVFLGLLHVWERRRKSLVGVKLVRKVRIRFLVNLFTNHLRWFWLIFIVNLQFILELKRRWSVTVAVLVSNLVLKLARSGLRINYCSSRRWSTLSHLVSLKEFLLVIVKRCLTQLLHLIFVVQSLLEGIGRLSVSYTRISPIELLAIKC